MTTVDYIERFVSVLHDKYPQVNVVYIQEIVRQYPMNQEVCESLVASAHQKILSRKVSESPSPAYYCWTGPRGFASPRMQLGAGSYIQKRHSVQTPLTPSPLTTPPHLSPNSRSSPAMVQVRLQSPAGLMGSRSSSNIPNIRISIPQQRSLGTPPPGALSSPEVVSSNAPTVRIVSYDKFSPLTIQTSSPSGGGEPGGFASRISFGPKAEIVKSSEPQRAAGRFYTHDDYLAVLMENQNIRMTNMKKALADLKSRLDELRSDVDATEVHLLHRRKRSQGVLQTVSEEAVRLLHKDTRVLQADNNSMMKELRFFQTLAEQQKNKLATPTPTGSTQKSSSNPKKLQHRGSKKRATAVFHCCTPEEKCNACTNIGESWVCAACTFENHPDIPFCEMCEMPRPRIVESCREDDDGWIVLGDISPSVFDSPGHLDAPSTMMLHFH